METNFLQYRVFSIDFVSNFNRFNIDKITSSDPEHTVCNELIIGRIGTSGLCVLYKPYIRLFDDLASFYTL